MITFSSPLTRFNVFITKLLPPPTASWGGMLGEGRPYLFEAPHLTLVPGLAIAVSVVAFNLLGDVLRDHLDPRFQPRHGLIEGPGSDKLKD